MREPLCALWWWLVCAAYTHTHNRRLAPMHACACACCTATTTTTTTKTVHIARFAVRVRSPPHACAFRVLPCALHITVSISMLVANRALMLLLDGPMCTRAIVDDIHFGFYDLIGDERCARLSCRGEARDEDARQTASVHALHALHTHARTALATTRTTLVLLARPGSCLCCCSLLGVIGMYS